MATRKRGMRNIPDVLSQARHIFPLVPFRVLIPDIQTSGTFVGEVVDLDLQFEDNEVLDVYSMQVDFNLDTVQDAVDALSQWGVGLFEDPDKASNTNLLTNDNWETDNSLVHAEMGSVGMAVVGTATAINYVEAPHRYKLFEQPYTVGRNLKVIAGFTDIVGAMIADMDCYVQLWGRRRNADDAEFKNIIYRQRF